MNSARQLAKDRGDKFYDCGRNCVRHETTIRYVSSGACPKCMAVSRPRPPQVLARRLETNRKRYREDEVFREKKKKEAQDYRTRNADRVLESARRYYQDNRDACNMRVRLRKEYISQATPSWLTAEHYAEMANLYARARQATEATSIAHHVDHIVPLRGKSVSGLNVPWNLRILTGVQNLAKRATMPAQEDLHGHTTCSIYYVPTG